MLLIELPKLPWDETQLLYHALGRLGIEALALTRSASPYLCVGFSGGVEAEADTAYCSKEGIGVFRREIGGGTVFIDSRQLLVQLVLKRERPGIPAGQAAFFKKYLGPLVEVYRELGLDAEFRPINDILVDGRKISGTGGGEIGDCAVLGTNILEDFDFERMARALRCPSDAFRSAVLEGMRRNMTTLKQELGPGRLPTDRGLRGLVKAAYERLLGPVQETELPSGVRAEMERLRGELFSKKWLGDRGARHPWREVKLREGSYVAQLLWKGIDVLVETSEGRIVSAMDLEGRSQGPWKVLVGLPYSEEEVLKTRNAHAGER